MNEPRAIRDRMWMGVLFALVLGATPVVAQQPIDPRLDRIRAELPQEAVQRIEAALTRARQNGLPVEPLLDKAVEGIAKRVAAPRVAGAVDQLVSELARSRTLLADGPPASGVELAAVADALRRGVPEHAVQRIAARAGPGVPVALATHTLGDLLDRGVPVENALDVLEAWSGRGGHADELRELPAAVERLIRQGTLPAQAAAAVATAVRAGQIGPPGADRPGTAPGQPSVTPPIPPGAGPPSERGRPTGRPGGPPGGG